MQKRILVPNGNYTDIPLIQAYKNMGLYVITSGNAPYLKGHEYADEYAPFDYSDKQGMLLLAEKLDLDFVSSCANDFGVLTGAYIAEKLRFPGHDTFSVAQIIAEKDCFKDFAQQKNLMVIPSRKFYDEESALYYARQADYPIIIKPTDLTGGKGVSRVDSPEYVATAISYAFACSKTKHIVIEPFVEGTQHSFCAFIVSKRVVTYTSFNEFDSPYNPFLVGFTSSPAENMDVIAPIMIDQVEKIANLLDLVDGIFHVQYRVHEGKPLIMECMRRCLGNYALQCAKYMLGFELEPWIARAYCGLNCSDIPRVSDRGKWHAHFYIQAPRNGYIKSVNISSKLTPFIYRSIMQMQVGQNVKNHETEMIGFLFLAFSDKETRDDIVSCFSELVTVEISD